MDHSALDQSLTKYAIVLQEIHLQLWVKMVQMIEKLREIKNENMTKLIMFKKHTMKWTPQLGKRYFENSNFFQILIIFKKISGYWKKSMKPLLKSNTQIGSKLANTKLIPGISAHIQKSMGNSLNFGSVNIVSSICAWKKLTGELKQYDLITYR